MKSLLGLSTQDSEEPDGRQNLTEFDPLQDLFPHRHRPESLQSLASKTRCQNIKLLIDLWNVPALKCVLGQFSVSVSVIH